MLSASVLSLSQALSVSGTSDRFYLVRLPCADLFYFSRSFFTPASLIWVLTATDFRKRSTMCTHPCLQVEILHRVLCVVVLVLELAMLMYA